MIVNVVMLFTIILSQRHQPTSENQIFAPGLSSIREGKEWSKVEYRVTENGWVWSAIRSADRYMFIIYATQFNDPASAKKSFDSADFGGQQPPSRGSYTGRLLGDGSWFSGPKPIDSTGHLCLLVLSGQTLYGARLNAPTSKLLRDAKPIPMSQRKFLEDFVLDVIHSRAKP